MRTPIWPVALLAAGILNVTPVSAQISPASNAPGPQPPVATVFPEGARLAFVDVDRVAALSTDGQAAATQLRDLRARRSAELSERGKQVQALQLKLSRPETDLTPVARRRLEREFQRAQVDFQRFSEDAEEEVRDLQQELLQAFTAKLFPVIDSLARERNLWAVFSSETTLLWHDPALDLSEEVAKRVDAAARRAQ